MVIGHRMFIYGGHGHESMLGLHSLTDNFPAQVGIHEGGDAKVFSSPVMSKAIIPQKIYELSERRYLGIRVALEGQDIFFVS